MTITTTTATASHSHDVALPLSSCPICLAAVRDEMLDQHYAWHQQVAIPELPELPEIDIDLSGVDREVERLDRRIAELESAADTSINGLAERLERFGDERTIVALSATEVDRLERLITEHATRLDVRLTRVVGTTASLTSHQDLERQHHELVETVGRLDGALAQMQSASFGRLPLSSRERITELERRLHELEMELHPVSMAQVGDRVEDGGVWGTVVTCDQCLGSGRTYGTLDVVGQACGECDGQGTLHQPDLTPMTATPDELDRIAEPIVLEMRPEAEIMAERGPLPWSDPNSDPMGDIQRAAETVRGLSHEQHVDMNRPWTWSPQSGYLNVDDETALPHVLQVTPRWAHPERAAPELVIDRTVRSVTWDPDALVMRVDDEEVSAPWPVSIRRRGASIRQAVEESVEAIGQTFAPVAETIRGIARATRLDQDGQPIGEPVTRGYLTLSTDSAGMLWSTTPNTATRSTAAPQITSDNNGVTISHPLYDFVVGQDGTIINLRTGHIVAQPGETVDSPTQVGYDATHSSDTNPESDPPCESPELPSDLP